MKSVYRIGIEQLTESKWLSWMEMEGDKQNIRRKVTASAKDAIQALNDIYKAEFNGES
jgi:hypothetical protein